MLLPALAAAPLAAQHPGQPQLTPLIAEVLAPPRAVRGSDELDHLVYEIRIANLTDARFTLRRVVVLGERDTTLAQLDAHAIGTRLSLGARRGNEGNVLGSAQFGVLFMHVAVAHEGLPKVLTHVIEGHAEKASADFTLRLASTGVIAAPARSLAAPLRGSGFVAGDGCCDSVRHVRALLPLNGRLYLAQRFAIDWEKVDDSGRVFVGDPRSVRSYRIYDEPVYAVADGTVVASRNDLKDQVPGKLPEGLPLEEADGNFAIIDIGAGAYALYAHMRLGSVALHAGQHVRRGEQIGNVGNTGNTQAPHLHFQLMDAPSALVANGLPYAFVTYTVTATDQAGTADFDRAEASGTPMSLTAHDPPLQGHSSLPLDLSVVTWTPAAPDPAGRGR
jgi:hypothetical protein